MLHKRDFIAIISACRKNLGCFLLFSGTFDNILQLFCFLLKQKKKKKKKFTVGGF